MKQSNASTRTSIRTVHVVTLVAAFAIASAAAVCTTNAKTETPSPTNAETKPASAEKTPVLRPVTYNSRNYGVSFAYPWQYAFRNAKTIAESSADASLRPRPDGHDSEVTLARIDIPKGDYEGTNFESGYFTLSLDQGITSESECVASFGVLEGGPIETDTVNGRGFHWIDLETQSEDRGEASKVREYKTFTNGACYEVEMGVKTRNQDGLAQEVNPDSVMLRLDSILRTIEIAPDQKTVTVETASSTK